MTKQPIKILQILDCISIGSGIANVVLNWHRNIDKTQVQFDYLIFEEINPSFKEEINKLGGNVYTLPYPSFLKPWKFIYSVLRFFKERRYTAIHSHITHLNFFYFPIAKFYGVKNIILHAHGTKWSDKFLNGVRNRIMLRVVRILITHKFACGEAAGKVWYGKNYKVIPNGIDLTKFAFNPATRHQVREELGLKDSFVILHAGRFSTEKNHLFLLDVFNEVYKRNNKAVLLLAGKGPLEDKIRLKTNKLGLERVVKFLGMRNDIQNIYQAADVFLLPSLQEGFPLAALEAQAAGLGCILSDSVTKEAGIFNTFFLPLSHTCSWADEVSNIKLLPREKGCEALNACGFSSGAIIKQLMSFYSKLES